MTTTGLFSPTDVYRRMSNPGTWPVTTGDFEAIDSVSTGTAGNIASIEFTDIPQDYYALLVTFIDSGNGTYATYPAITWSGLAVSAFNWAFIYAEYNGTPGGSQGVAGSNTFYANSLEPSAGYLYIPNYTSTTEPKQMWHQGGAGKRQRNFGVLATQTSTLPITSLKIDMGVTRYWSSWSQVTLYGVGRC